MRCRCSFRRLWAVQASSHSLSHAARLRRDIMVSFWQVLSCPNTGSTVRERDAGKRIIADSGGELFGRAQNHRNSEAEAPGNLLGDADRNGFSGGATTAKQNVTALDVRLHVGAADFDKHLNQIPHRKAILAANIDAAQ